MCAFCNCYSYWYNTQNEITHQREGGKDEAKATYGKQIAYTPTTFAAFDNFRNWNYHLCHAISFSFHSGGVSVLIVTELRLNGPELSFVSGFSMCDCYRLNRFTIWICPALIVVNESEPPAFRRRAIELYSHIYCPFQKDSFELGRLWMYSCRKYNAKILSYIY